MAIIDDLVSQIQDEALRDRISNEIKKQNKTKKFGLVFEEHLPECTPLYDLPIKAGNEVALKAKEIKEIYIVLSIKDEKVKCCLKNNNEEIKEFEKDELVRIAEFGEPVYPYLKPIDSICNNQDSDLWHTLIEADNYHALQLLEYLYAGKVDCIYIDPPYNTGARDWKYNNDYVDSADSYRHSKWLSFIEKRLKIAKKLLNPLDSVLIVTIDEKEYLHLGCLLEEMFPEANIQMITDVINPRGTNRENEFSRVEEYIFVCRFGNASITKTDNNMLGNTDETGKARVWYAFNRGNNPRSSSNAQFYPIYIDEENKKIIQIGESMSIDSKQSDFPVIDGLTAVFPINDRGGESIWRAIPETTRKWVEAGYVKVSKYDKKNKRWTLSYIPTGMQQRIESGEIEVDGKLDDGSLNLQHIDSTDEKVSPRTVWYQQTHNATDYGATIIKNIICDHKFSYPKSLYSERDTLEFFVANKPHALIVDFFAGSGTTLHAVNLLNEKDGGQRRCILITNNEVSEEEAKTLKGKGYNPGDVEWEELGIARYVTWPRTVCSIKGIDINNNKLEGEYIGINKKMSEGFKTNANYFKLGFLDKNSVALGKQFKELLPVLWMKANAIGECPKAPRQLPDYLILEKNRFAVLINEDSYYKFIQEIKKENVDVIFFVTDSENSYKEMIGEFNDKETYQLYRDYLDNFRINVRRN